MKLIITFLVSALITGSLLGAEEKKATKFETLTTVDGKTYSGVTVREVTPSGIKILHEAGVATLPFEKLPKEIQDQLGGFDSDAAAKHRATEEAKQRQNEEGIAAAERANAEIAKQVEQDKKAARWIVGKVQRVQDNGILVRPPREYEGRVSRVSSEDQLGVTPAGLERYKREKGSLPGDFQAYLGKGGTFFGSVRGMEYMAKNWIKNASDYEKYFTLENLYQTRNFLKSLAVFPPIDTDQAIFVRTTTSLGVVDDDFVSLWIVPDETAKSEGGRTFRGYRLLGRK
jgi:hypothetical protein